MPKRIQITNLTRDVLMIPVEGGMPKDQEQIWILGDKVDTDDQVPEVEGKRRRDVKFQPHPVWVGTVEQFNAFGTWAIERIEEFVSMGRLSKVELA